MSEYRVTYSTFSYLDVDVEDLKEQFEDEWAEVLLDGYDDEEFVTRLFQEYGWQYFIDNEFFVRLREDQVDLFVEEL